MASVKKNFLYQSAYEILVIILPLITSPYISRVLGPENLGIYSYTYSIAYYFSLFASLGIKYYGNRRIAQARNSKQELSKVFSEILYAHLVTSCIVLVIYLGYVSFFVKENQLYSYIQAIYVLGSVFDLNWFFFGMEKFDVTVKRNTIIKILTVISIFAFVRRKTDLIIYIWIMALGNLLAQLYLWTKLKREVSICTVSIKACFRHLKPLCMLFIPLAASSIYQVLSKIILGNISGDYQLGLFDNTQKLINIPMSLVIAFGNVMLPKMSNMFKNYDQEKGMIYLERTVPLIMCIAFSLCFGLISVADIFAPVFWGKEFSAASKLVAFNALVIPFYSFANMLRTQFLIPRGRDNVYTFAMVGGAVINIIVNIILIPYYGAMGAVCGNIAAEASVSVIQAVWIRKEVRIKRYIKLGVPFFIIGFFMYFVVKFVGKFVDQNVIGLAVEIALGALVYCTLSLIYFIKSKNEFVLSILKNIKRKWIK